MKRKTAGRTRRAVLAASLSFLIMLSTSRVAFASPSVVQDGGGGGSSDLFAFFKVELLTPAEQEAMGAIYNVAGELYMTLLTIAAMLAAVSLAVAGLLMLLGTTKDFERAIGKIKIIFMAIAAFYLLPVAIVIAVKVGGKFNWIKSKYYQ